MSSGDRGNSLSANKRIHVALCADLGFAMPLAVTLASLAKSSTSTRVTAHIVHPGFSTDTRARLGEGADSLDLRWYKVDERAMAGVHNTEFLSAAALYRLMLGSLLPKDLTRVIYLDSDTVVLGNLAELYSLVLEDSTVGAVRDAWSPWAAGVCGPNWRELELDPGLPYFNSGVLLIDLDRWRSEAVGDRCVELLQRVDARWGDQDALNAVLVGRWCEIPRRWNVQTPDFEGSSFAWALWRSEIEGAILDPGLIHYTLRTKPWTAGSEHPQKDKWFQALDRTAWRGWRPAQRTQRDVTLRRFADTARSARQRWRERRHRLPT